MVISEQDSVVSIILVSECRVADSNAHRPRTSGHDPVHCDAEESGSQHTAILDLVKPEIAPFDPPTPKTVP